MEEKIKKMLLVLGLLLRITIINQHVLHCYSAFKIPRVILLLLQVSCDFRVSAYSYHRTPQSGVLSLHQNYGLDNHKNYLQHAFHSRDRTEKTAETPEPAAACFRSEGLIRRHSQ